MNSQSENRQWSVQRLLLVTGLLSIVIGSLTGLGLGLTASYLGPQTREFYLFNGSLPFNETVFGISHDTFTPDRMTVDRGDTIVVHYINIEDTAESHTFSMGIAQLAPGPYNIDQVVAAGHNVTITFNANFPGVFRYVCKFHQPTMTGYLTVLG